MTKLWYARRLGHTPLGKSYKWHIFKDDKPSSGLCGHARKMKSPMMTNVKPKSNVCQYCQRLIDKPAISGDRLIAMRNMKAKGATVTQIADHFGVGFNTAKKHTAGIKRGGFETLTNDEINQEVNEMLGKRAIVFDEAPLDFCGDLIAAWSLLRYFNAIEASRVMARLDQSDPKIAARQICIAWVSANYKARWN